MLAGLKRLSGALRFVEGATPSSRMPAIAAFLSAGSGISRSSAGSFSGSFARLAEVLPVIANGFEAQPFRANVMRMIAMIRMLAPQKLAAAIKVMLRCADNMAILGNPE